MSSVFPHYIWRVCLAHLFSCYLPSVLTHLVVCVPQHSHVFPMYTYQNRQKSMCKIPRALWEILSDRICQRGSSDLPAGVAVRVSDNTRKYRLISDYVWALNLSASPSCIYQSDFISYDFFAFQVFSVRAIKSVI